MNNKQKELVGKIMKTILIILTFLAATEIYSQPTEQWTKRISGSGYNDDIGYDIVSDGTGSVYAAGTYYNSTAGNRSFSVEKMSAATGNMTWQVQYNGSGNTNDGAKKILIDGNGNIYAVGFLVNTNKDLFIAKLTPTGAEIWTRTYSYQSTSSEDVNSIAIDAAGNLYIAGYKQTGANKDGLTIKYNAAGLIQWAQTYDSGNDADEVNDVTVGDSGYVYITGRTENDMLTAKYTSSGAVKWQRSFTNGSINLGNAITLDAAGSIYVTGQEQNNPPKGVTTVKYNSQGTLLWNKYSQYSSSSIADIGLQIAVSGSGVYVAGNSEDNLHISGITLLKYDLAGNVIWSKRFNRNANHGDYLSSMKLDASGNIYLNGYSEGIGTSFDFLLVKYNSAGTQLWIQTYNGIDNLTDVSQSMAIDTSGNIYLHGYSYSASGGKDIFTIKYSQLIGIQPVGNEVPSEYKLSQNYPNPFNPSTNIEFSVLKTGNVNISVFDITGKEIAVLLNKQLSAGKYKIDFDGSNLSSGTYFYRIESGNFNSVKKMMLVK